MTRHRVMLLIDADNVSVDVMAQAVELLQREHGAVHVRRAYCTAESAVKHQAAFKRLGIKPMVNLAAGKNSTDIALAVDAIDLVMSERPEVVVIASSDSDFAPLVLRLREKGCHVLGIGQQGKTGDETQAVYDGYTVLEHHGGTTARKTAAKKAAAKTAAPRKSAAKTTTKAAAAQEAAASAPDAAPAASTAAKSSRAAARTAPRPAGRAAAKTAAKTPATAAPAPPPPPRAVAPAPTVAARSASTAAAGPTLQVLLDCLPDLAAGQTLELGTVAARLRQAGLLGRSASSARLLARFAPPLELLPPGQPNHVRLRR
jgi:uncharacterized protein (TIGR00288 family)